MNPKQESKGTLYLCATPIGNLEDMTFRAVRILKEVDLIACEDTRNSVKLLNHYEIKTPYTSYHEHNKYDKGKILLERLMSGKNIALISDAGMPGISDPGEELVKMCIGEGVLVTALPGASAFILAAVLSGFSTRAFIFEGFLPKDKKEIKSLLEGVKESTKTLIFYEAPHRLLKTLELLYVYLGERRVSLAKEITKRYENINRTTLKAAIDFYRDNPPKGEFVIVIEGANKEELEEKEREKWGTLSLEEHMEYYSSKEISKKEAMKLVAKDRGISKREVYKLLLEKEEA